MIVWLRHVLGWLRSAFCAREDLILENLALRQQLLALHAQRPRGDSLRHSNGIETAWFRTRQIRSQISLLRRAARCQS